MLPIKQSNENKINITQYETTRQDDAVESEVKQLRTEKLIMDGLRAKSTITLNSPGHGRNTFQKLYS